MVDLWDRSWSSSGLGLFWCRVRKKGSGKIVKAFFLGEFAIFFSGGCCFWAPTDWPPNPPSEKHFQTLALLRFDAQNLSKALLGSPCNTVCWCVTPAPFQFPLYSFPGGDSHTLVLGKQALLLSNCLQRRIDVSACLVAQSHPTLCKPLTVAHQAPLSMEFSRQEYWSGLPFPLPGDLPNPGTEPKSPASPALTGEFFTTVPLGKIKWHKTGSFLWCHWGQLCIPTVGVQISLPLVPALCPGPCLFSPSSVGLGKVGEPTGLGRRPSREEIQPSPFAGTPIFMNAFVRNVIIWFWRWKHVTVMNTHFPKLIPTLLMNPPASPSASIFGWLWWIIKMMHLTVWSLELGLVPLVLRRWVCDSLCP